MLVVDDNAINREVAVAMLTELRCNVEVAEDGRVAVAKAALQRFDVILMDCQMPGMDGYAATEAIREDERQRGLATAAIIALSANVLARDRERCLQSGMDSFLAKPFKCAQLVEAMRPIAQARGRLPSAMPRPAAAPVASTTYKLIDEVPKLPAPKARSVALVSVPKSAAPALDPILIEEPLLTETGAVRMLETAPEPARETAIDVARGSGAVVAPAGTRRGPGPGDSWHRQAEDLRASLRNAVRIVT